MNPPSLDRVRAAQAKLLATSSVALSGVGIVKKDGVLGLKVNVARNEDCRLLPTHIDEVPIHTVESSGSLEIL